MKPLTRRERRAILGASRLLIYPGYVSPLWILFKGKWSYVPLVKAVNDSPEIESLLWRKAEDPHDELGRLFLAQISIEVWQALYRICL